MHLVTAEQKYYRVCGSYSKHTCLLDLQGEVQTQHASRLGVWWGVLPRADSSSHSAPGRAHGEVLVRSLSSGYPISFMRRLLSWLDAFSRPHLEKNSAQDFELGEDKESIYLTLYDSITATPSRLVLTGDNSMHCSLCLVPHLLQNQCRDRNCYGPRSLSSR